MKTTGYFETRALARHPEARNVQRIDTVFANPVESVRQADGRIRRWGWVLDDSGVQRIMRVVTLEDGVTVHNAFFFDRNYERKLR